VVASYRCRRKRRNAGANFLLGQRSICHIIGSGEDWLGYSGLQNGRE